MLAKRSFKFKLISSYIIVILISFGFIAFFLDKHLEKNSLQSIQASLVTQGYLIENQIAPDDVKKEDLKILDGLIKILSPRANCRLTVINIKGKVLADSEETREGLLRMENHLSRPEVRTALTGAVGTSTHYSSVLKTDMLYVALPLKEKDQIIGILRLAIPLESVQKTLGEIRRIVFIGLLFALGVAFILGSLLAARTIQPINRMIQVSRKYSEGDFSRRIVATSGDEIGELASTLNKMAQDIEDKIKEIRAQNEKLAATFNCMIEGIVVVDKMGRVISVNSTVERIFRTSKEELEGKNFLEAIRNNDISEIINDVLNHGEPLSKEISLVLPVRKVFQINASPIFDNEGVSGCLIVIHDITEIRRLETVRSDFVANVSHELKTPLTSIKGFIETLLEGAIDDKENNRHFLKIIQDHAERLNNLVEDLLSLSDLESEETRLEIQDFDLRQELEDIILGFRSQLKKRNVEVRNELPAALSVSADKEKIGRVLTNLIDNAIKFNKDQGWIRITSQPMNGHIKITVEDSGVGIPERDLSRIFERFYRVDKARSRELGGTGLGLSIVKHTIELHKGSVGVDSVEGTGSRFWFTLPI